MNEKFSYYINPDIQTNYKTKAHYYEKVDIFKKLLKCENVDTIDYEDEEGKLFDPKMTNELLKKVYKDYDNETKKAWKKVFGK